MAYWRWDPVYSVGIAVIDNQHKRIIEYINELSHIATYESDNQVVHDVIFKLLDYTVSHFSFEESLMEEAKYPLLEPHKKVHEAFIERINFFKERFENGEDISKQLMLELQMWLINHIQHNDTDYAQVVQHMLEKKKITPEKDDETKSTWLKSLVNNVFN